MCERVLVCCQARELAVAKATRESLGVQQSFIKLSVSSSIFSSPRTNVPACLPAWQPVRLTLSVLMVGWRAVTCREVQRYTIRPNNVVRCSEISRQLLLRLRSLPPPSVPALPLVRTDRGVQVVCSVALFTLHSEFPCVSLVQAGHTALGFTEPR